MTEQFDSAYLSIRNLQKTYPKTSAPAVNDVNLDVTQGDLVALLGPSGCGKTTTLRMVAGLLEPTSGQIFVNGKDVVSTPVHKRGMGMVFQSYALFPHMTVEENVAFGLQMHKVARSKIAERTAEALEMVQLGHLKGRRPSELSGGQQQRVALARALVIHPTLFVTHDQDEALDMADRIAILNNGEIEQSTADGPHTAGISAGARPRTSVRIRAPSVCAPRKGSTWRGQRASAS